MGGMARLSSLGGGRGCKIIKNAKIIKKGFLMILSVFKIIKNRTFDNFSILLIILEPLQDAPLQGVAAGNTAIKGCCRSSSGGGAIGGGGGGGRGSGV